MKKYASEMLLLITGHFGALQAEAVHGVYNKNLKS